MQIGDDRDTNLSEMIEDDRNPSPEDYANQNSMRREVLEMLQELKPKEKEVLLLRFGLEDGNEWTLTKIAKRLNLSRERVRQLQSRAISTLRHNHPHALREYLAG